MSLWNTGSLADHVGVLVGWTNISAGVSGVMTTVAEQAVNFANTYTNDNIGYTDIAAKYQPALICLMQADVLMSVDANDGGVSSVKLGELSVSEGNAGGYSNMAMALRQSGIDKLKELGRSLRFKKVIGGV